MRPIKFRAWSKTNNTMLYNPTTPLNINEREELGLNDFLAWLVDGVELMQFTGLCDKTGKEIYESDIVKIIRHFESKRGRPPAAESRNYIAEIVFENFAFRMKNHTMDWTAIIGLDLPDYEVIGNIYEHPHLLNH